MSPVISQLFDLTGKTALVTGATGYLGRPLSEALAEAGATVVAASTTQSKAEEFARELSSHSRQPQYGVTLDYRTDESILAGYEAAIRAVGTIDILVNNGQIPESRDWKSIDSAGFEQQMRIASAYFSLAHLVRDRAVERKTSASIVSIGSMYGLVGSYPEVYEGISNASSVAYHTLKGGIAHMTRHLAVYWARDQVRVNTLSPGPFPNPNKVNPLLTQRISAKSPLGRVGQPYELKGAIVFLASDASSYVTGHNLVVDGGWTAW